MKTIIKTKKFWILLILLLGFAGGAWMITQDGLQVDVIEAAAQTVEDTVTEKGVIETGIYISQAAQISGTVQEVCVKENQAVKKGDVLLYINSTDISQEIAIQTC